MAAAAIPLIELGIQELPVFLPAILNAINAVKNIIHKSPGAAKMTPEQTQAAQTAALNLAKPVMITAAASANVPLPGDDQTSKMIEAVYQIGKVLTASPITSVAKVGASISPTLDALLPFIVALQQIRAEIQAAQGVTP